MYSRLIFIISLLVKPSLSRYARVDKFIMLCRIKTRKVVPGAVRG